ncbi:MAG: iron dependent repressor, metal binding and dimerization domain protein [Cyclobacteriaceae bacterium]
MAPFISLLIFILIVILGVGIWKLTQSSWFLQNVLHTKKELAEDVLKQLFHVEQSGKLADLNAMSGALSISQKKLIEVVEEMTVSGLIRIENEQLQLTSGGKAYATRIVRMHRLWEMYLSEYTGFDKIDWHELAEKKEHQMTSPEVTALSLRLGNPRFDPHGDPIPTESGEVFRPSWQPLPSIKKNEKARIVHIEDEPAPIYKQILSLKLTRGSQLIVVENNEKQITILSEGIEHQLSPIIASNINVEKLTDKEHYEQNAIRLSSLSVGKKGKVIGLSADCRGSARRRLLDLGFVTGSSVEVALENPLDEPKAYNIRNTLVALRNDQADYIIIEKEN